jgi:hypothetical protein
VFYAQQHTDSAIMYIRPVFVLLDMRVARRVAAALISSIDKGLNGVRH